jgi:hypothetical protein
LSPLESSLSSQGCQACHPKQFAEWAQSRHARAMGPGVLGQLLDMIKPERQACLDCHAPLAEQAESMNVGLREEKAVDIPKGLHLQGVTCSACHLRHYTWYGPPRRTDLTPLSNGQASVHSGWRAQKAFSDSLFCAACHQFPPEGNAVNGKLLENTYKEWQVSPQAKEGMGCQTCHMATRHHLFRGIHDPSMVSKAVRIEAEGPTLEGEVVSAGLTLANTGVGHLLPTYATPRLILAVYQTGAGGKMLAGSLRENVIGWSLSLDLAQEFSDTRLAPQQVAVLQYRAPLDPEATQLVFEVRVEPEAFYSQFYLALLENRLTAKGTSLIRQALDESLATRYLLFQITRTTWSEAERRK